MGKRVDEELLVAAADDERRGYRYRLVAGMAAVVVEKGYAATTIADIVRRARVSKRTFYQNFGDKEECFLASFSSSSRFLRRQVEDAAAGQDPWPDRIRAGVEAYLGALASQPALTRALLLEVPAAGPRAVALRRRELQRFADLLADLSRRAAPEFPGLRPLSPPICTALIGGINELIMLSVEEGRSAQLPELTGTIVELIAAVLSQPG
jgi:AcrR family transcriptional regulator